MLSDADLLDVTVVVTDFEVVGELVREPEPVVVRDDDVETVGENVGLGLVDTVFEQAGWSADDFVCFRAVVPYPPMPSTVMMRYRLPRAPGS